LGFSGTSAIGDLRALATRCLHPVGVTIPELTESALVELEGLAGAPLPLWDMALPVLVDTSAFSEVEFGPEGPRVVRPIDAAGWEYRLAVMERLTRALGAQCYLVAPDRVGDQRVTLDRLATYAPRLRALRAAGARIIVAIQRGPLLQAAFDRACAEVLGFDDFIRGIPGNKDAIGTRELIAYAMAVRPRAVHLLGIGPQARRFRRMVAVFCRANEDVEVSCDSNMIAANVGHENGRGGGPRSVTAWSRYYEENPGEVRPDWTPREAAVFMAFRPQILWHRFSKHAFMHHNVIFTIDGRPPPTQFAFPGVLEVSK
jgi:hypothetical protein